MTESKKYWDNRYASGGNSGYGSAGEQLKKKLKWLSGLDIKTVSEIGCGDLRFASALGSIYPQANYQGQDISDVIITQHKKNFLKEIQFTTDIDKLPASDLLLCIDVLFHVLDDAELATLFQKIDEKWNKYLAVTAYERDEPYTPGSHVKIRKFNYRRFGTPLIREVVEEDGQMYFYLFKRPEIDVKKTSCCLITKDPVYPLQIVNFLSQFGFGEMLILTNSDSPYRKHELFKKAKYETIYYQDDDAICPVQQLFDLAKPEMINVAMKKEHAAQYENRRMTMGLGWGSIFPKHLLGSLKKYTKVYQDDEIFRRETERIFTYLNYPQNRLVLPIVDLPSAYAQDRLWRQPQHYSNIDIVEERCKDLV